MWPKTAFLRTMLCMLGIVLFTAASAQSLYKVSLDEKVQNSSLIVEGKVMGQKSYWSPDHTMIYTVNTVEVYKVFKGTASPRQIEVMTLGGNVGGESISTSDLLSLSNENIGVFFCSPNPHSLKSPATNQVMFDVYSSLQGFFAYNLDEQTAGAPFVRYSSITGELYPELQKKAGRSYTDLKPSFKVTDGANTSGTQRVASISGFSPTTVDAGALLNPSTNWLTITGSGFGTFSGSAAILFADGNNGGSSDYVVAAADKNTKKLILDWTDTKITVAVPSRASTGSVKVRDAAGTVTTAPGTLTVRFSILTASFDLDGQDTAFYVKESNLMNDNGSGGYTIFYSNNTAGRGVDFNASPAKATFQRALNTWKEIAGFNVTEGGAVSNQVVNPSDGVNVVMFDNDNAGPFVTPLASGTLAVCFSFNSMCTSNFSANQAQKTEFDVVVRNSPVSTGSTTFTLGPCPPASTSFSDIDLETVMLHELGHALNLGHINDSYQTVSATYPEVNPGKLMHYAVLSGVKRTSPDYSAKAGADYAIQPQGNTYGGPCGLASGEMTPLVPIVESKDECPVSFPNTQVLGGTTVAFDIAHATSNKFGDPQFTRVNCAGTGTGVTNTAFYALRTDGNGGALSINVTNYATVPGSQSACTPWAGVEMALYAVSSCPTGQAFPTPFACRTFNANGALTSITGLAANTNYLLMVDGIESTKATFSLTFAGNALPLTLSDFRGEAKKDHNLLTWVVDLARDIKTVHVEHSADGLTWEKLGEVTGTLANRKGSYADYKPFIGDNYYRLAVVNLDNSKEYSKIILLKRDDKLLVNVYPNPVRGVLNVDINSVTKGKYVIRLHNAIGQQVVEKQVTVTSPNERVKIGTGQLANGVYHVSVLDEKNELVKTMQIVIK